MNSFSHSYHLRQLVLEPYAMEGIGHEYLLILLVLEANCRDLFHRLRIDNPKVRLTLSCPVNPRRHQDSCVLLLAVGVRNETRIACRKVVFQGEHQDLLSANVELDPCSCGVLVGAPSEWRVLAVHDAMLSSRVFRVGQREIEGVFLAVQVAGDDFFLGVLSVALQDEAVVAGRDKLGLVGVPRRFVQKSSTLEDCRLKDRRVFKCAQVKDNASILLLVGVCVVEGE
mmetsp:Transcript_21542/g.40531  ORF Transcript_21542/g.40531 Transcript_21542/m.40531 type:complete len:227 (-) Transcript_21542:1047-1727(-)